MIDPNLYMHPKNHEMTVDRFAQSDAREESPNWLDYCLQVHVQDDALTASKYMSQLPQLSSAGATRFVLKHYLWAAHIYGV